MPANNYPSSSKQAQHSISFYMQSYPANNKIHIPPPPLSIQRPRSGFTDENTKPHKETQRSPVVHKITNVFRQNGPKPIESLQNKRLIP